MSNSLNVNGLDLLISVNPFYDDPDSKNDSSLNNLTEYNVTNFAWIGRI